MLVSDRRRLTYSRNTTVLILVLVDVGLGLGKDRLFLFLSERVLILVLVDVGLGRTGIGLNNAASCGLNPCFSGCWSRTARYIAFLAGFLS